ncbi:TlpA family protein disulfide reductase, partial [bacterium]|nr:TlpA family protein disulfide reductase [bacterium]
IALFFLVSCDLKSTKYKDESEINKFLSEYYFTVPEKALYLKDFEYQVFNGNKENLDSNQGKIILLNFWATWCFPCRKEMPDLEELNHLMKGEKFRILAIGVGENEERVKRFLEKYPYSFDIALDQDRKITKSMEIAGLPTTFVIDTDGRVLGKMIGPVDWKQSPMVEFFRTISKK